MNKKISFFIICSLLSSTVCPIFRISLVSSNGTQLYLNPNVIQIPLVDLGQNFTVIAVRLNISNVNGLKSFSLNFAYDAYILEYLGFGEMDDWFYNTVGGWIGGDTQGELSKTFSGSATMFIYYFKVLHTGSTQIRLTETRLWDESGNAISHTASGCTINVLPFEEWIDGEYAELSIRYDELLENYNNLMSEYNSLNTTHNLYIESHSHNDDEYNSLLSENQMLISNFGTSQTLNYVLIIVSIILVATTVYFAKKKT